MLLAIKIILISIFKAWRSPIIACCIQPIHLLIYSFLRLPIISFPKPILFLLILKYFTHHLTSFHFLYFKVLHLSFKFLIISLKFHLISLKFHYFDPRASFAFFVHLFIIVLFPKLSIYIINSLISSVLKSVFMPIHQRP